MRTRTSIAAQSVLYILYAGISLTAAGMLAIIATGDVDGSFPLLAAWGATFTTLAELGLLLLILSPLVGVATLMGSSLLEKDYRHAAVAFLVVMLVALAMLLGSL
ncbi:MAG: DUF1634 domain-containing protein [Spirochaetia bacterium]|nr:DUF1634 domain-containing protein [Spirochaetia bacterium]